MFRCRAGRPAALPAFLFWVAATLSMLGGQFAFAQEPDYAPRFTLGPSAAADSVPAAAKVAFTLHIEAPDSVREHLQRHLDLQHYQELQDLDKDELLRLLQAARADVSGLLATLGFFSPDFTLEAEDTPQAEAPFRVTLSVNPGDPVKIASVELHFAGAIDSSPGGTSALPSAERQAIEGAWSLRPGQVFTQAGWDEAKTEALRRLTATRYPTGRIVSSRADIDPDRHEARLISELDSGPDYRFGHISVEGTVHHEAELVRRLAQIPPGTLYTQARLLEAQQRVAESGFFDSVFFSIDTSREAQVADIRVQVREAKLKKLVLGVGASTDSGPRLSAEFTHRQVPGLGWKATSKLSLDRTTKTAGTEWLSPPDDANWRWTTSAQAQRQLSGSDPVNSLQLRAGRTKTEERFDRNLYLQYDHARTQSDPPDNASSLSMNYAWTQRSFDSMPFPSRGHGLAVELGTGLTLGSQRDPYIRTRARWLQFLPLSLADDVPAARSSRLAWRLEGGAVVARESATIPSTQRFLTGGDTTVRGYGYRQIGVTQTDGDLVAGRYLTVGSLEWQKPLLRNGRPTDWDGTVFIDAGAVADRPGELRAKVGVGIGARWRSPVGPLQVDLAWGQATRRLRLHLNVGFTF